MKRIHVAILLLVLLAFLGSCGRSNQNGDLDKKYALAPDNSLAPIPEGEYRLIANRSGNGCLDIRGDNSRMQIWGCGPSDKGNQKFTFKAGSSNVYTIINASRCLDVNEHNNSQDQLLQMY